MTFMISVLKNQQTSTREIIKMQCSLKQKTNLADRQMINYFFHIAGIEFELQAQELLKKK